MLPWRPAALKMNYICLPAAIWKHRSSLLATILLLLLLLLFRQLSRQFWLTLLTGFSAISTALGPSASLSASCNASPGGSLQPGVTLAAINVIAANQLVIQAGCHCVLKPIICNYWVMSHIQLFGTKKVLRISPGEQRLSLQWKRTSTNFLAARQVPGKAGSEERRTPSIVFLKTHKTGSSTVQNILFRFSERRKLTVAFPLYSYQFAYPERFSRAFVEDLPQGASHFNLLCSHMRLDLGEAQAIMPTRSVFLTILRDPAQTFESVFHYYRNAIPAFQPLANHSQPLLAFLKDSAQYYDAQDISNGLAKNPMAFDLGLNASWGETPSSLWQGELERLNHTFQLVMIAEHFDESLLLARELLGLEMEELVYVRLNIRRQEGKPLPKRLVQKIQAWNWLDVQLYKFFHRIFWHKVEVYGYMRMKRELDVFRTLLRETVARCLEGDAVGPENVVDDLRPWQPGSVVILGYRLRQNLTYAQYSGCFHMVLPELQYHAYLYYKQYGKDMRPLPTP